MQDLFLNHHPLESPLVTFLLDLFSPFLIPVSEDCFEVYPCGDFPSKLTQMMFSLCQLSIHAFQIHFSNPTFSVLMHFLCAHISNQHTAMLCLVVKENKGT